VRRPRLWRRRLRVRIVSTPPKVGFVSLGCPKALVDSERILTRLRAEGYDVVGSYEDANLVVVNTCGFIDDAVHESLDAIGEALARNGKVIVTGCLGAKPETITDRHPSVLKVTGPHAYEEVVSAVHEQLPPLHDPFLDLVPPQGIRLTPRHYAYLKISEGCNHRCTFCIIPSMRGNLASRPIGEVMLEAERLVKAGVKELLVISQDTSAYGADLKYATGFWGGKPVKARFTDLARSLGSLGAWVRLHYVYPYPHVDEVIPLMADGKVLPYLDIPFQHGSPRVLKLMKRPAHAENTLERIRRWRETCPDLTCAARSSSASPARRKTISRCCSTGSRRRSSIASAVSSIRRSKARQPMRCPIPCRMKSSSSATSASWSWRARSARKNWLRRSADRCACWWIRSTRTAPLPARRPTRPRSTARCASPGLASSSPATGLTS